MKDTSISLLEVDQMAFLCDVPKDELFLSILSDDELRDSLTDVAYDKAVDVFLQKTIQP